MKPISVFIFATRALAVAIRDSPTQPSCRPQIHDCEPFDSIIPDFPELPEWGSDDDASDDSMMSSAPEITDLEPIYTEPVGSVQYFENPSYSELPLSTEDRPSKLRFGASNFEANVREHIHELWDLKTKIHRDPQLLETQYPDLEDSIAMLEYERIILAADGYVQNETSVAEHKVLLTLVEMVNLYRDMRSVGCGKQLEIATDPESMAYGKSDLEALVEEKESFLSLVDHYFSEYSAVVHDDFAARVNTAKTRLRDLESMSSHFIAQGTILSRIFEEEISTFGRDLEQAIDEYGHRDGTEPEDKVTSDKTSKNIEDKTQDKEISDGDTVSEHVFRKTEKNLYSAYAAEYYNDTHIDMDAYTVWSDTLHKACDGAYDQVLSFESSEAPAKKRVERLVALIDQALAKKTNSFLLAATVWCTKTGPYDADDLELFSKLQSVYKHDMAYVEARLMRSVKFVRMYAVREADFEPDRVQKERASFERTAKYIHAVQWVALPGAERVRRLEEEAWDAFETLGEYEAESYPDSD